jgi:hypothetical protein
MNNQSSNENFIGGEELALENRLRMQVLLSLRDAAREFSPEKFALKS